MSNTFYRIKVHSSDGKEKQMEVYKDNVVLIVNVASQCGFTPQYQGLEALYNKYKDRGFRILAFPSNDFGGQEPGTMKEIEQFCSLNYGVTFELLDKVHAKGEEQHPLYAWLTRHSELQGDVRWNFEKFLISRGSGEIIARYLSNIPPDNAELIDAIEKAL